MYCQNSASRPIDKQKKLENRFGVPDAIFSTARAEVHRARAIARRAERAAVAAGKGVTLNPASLRYLNRLSDHLFVMARVLNGAAGCDVLWQPGATR